MDARTFDKTRLPSRHVTEGPSRAPHRSYFYAMGLTREQIHQPLVGVATCWNEAAPCNISLIAPGAGRQEGRRRGRRHAARVHHDHRHRRHRHGPPGHEVLAGVARGDRRFRRTDDARPLLRRAGGPGRLRQVAAGHDDGDVPAQRALGLHLWRLDPAGHFPRQQVTVQDLFEAVGSISVGKMSDEDLDELEQVACPSAGACGAQFTANTMATVSEAIGLALPYSAGAPAPYEIRDRFCMAAGEKVMELHRPQTSARATSSPARRWRMPPRSSPRRAARPMPACTCRRSRMNAGSSSISSTWRRFSSGRPISPI